MENSLDNLRLSKNFKSGEFKVSETYPEMASKICITPDHVSKLKLLCETLLQPIRKRWGATKVLSGVRSKELNLAIGGSDSSDHLSGCAADIYLPGQDILTVFNWVYGNKMHYRQAIWYPDQNFIHLSINIPGKEFKNETLKSEKGEYTKWGSN